MSTLIRLRALAAARALGMSIYSPLDPFELRWGKALAAIEDRAGGAVWGWIAEARGESELACAVVAAQNFRNHQGEQP